MIYRITLTPTDVARSVRCEHRTIGGGALMVAEKYLAEAGDRGLAGREDRDIASRLIAAAERVGTQERADVGGVVRIDVAD